MIQHAFDRVLAVFLVGAFFVSGISSAYAQPGNQRSYCPEVSMVGQGAFTEAPNLKYWRHDKTSCWGVDFSDTIVPQDPSKLSPTEANLYTRLGTSLVPLAGSASDFGDMDGDGDLDFIVTGEGPTSSSGGTTLIYENTGGGEFVVSEVDLPDVEGLGTVEWGDMDGDGDVDLVITGNYFGAGDQTGPIARIYENQGGGSFSRVEAGLVGVLLGSSDWGDYDNDGDLDLVITGYTFDRHISKIYRNDGGGNFTDVEASLEGVRFSSSDWADIDGDSDLDLIVTGAEDFTDPSTTVYENTGGDNFSPTDDNLIDITNGSSEFGDFDQDGDQDLLLAGKVDASGDVSKTVVYENDGSGSFAPVESGLVDVQWSSVDLGDVDGDGDTDIALSGQTLGRERVSRVYLNDGTARFTDLEAGLSGTTNGSTEFGDIDEDGDLDLVITGTDGLYREPSSRIYVNRRSQSGPNRAPTFSKGIVSDTIAAGLVFDAVVEVGDRDGDAVHLSLVSGTTENVSLTDYGNGIGQFVFSPSRSQMGETHFFTAQVTDSHGKTAQTSFSVRVPDSFARVDAGLTPVGGIASTSSDLGDIDKDGDLDLAVTGGTSEGRSTVVYLNNGGGHYTPSSNDVIDVSRGAVAIGDLNSDGAPDLIVAGNTTADYNEGLKTIVYDNNGTGQFGPPDQSLVGVQEGHIELGDIDSDSDLDLVLTGRTEAARRTLVYENDGGGGLTLVPSAGIDPTLGEIDIGDFDRNRTADVAVASIEESKLYEGSGSFEFSEFSTDLEQAETVDFGDMDGDGDLDLVITGQGSSAVYLQDGFIPATDERSAAKIVSPELEAVSSSSADLADFDGDGDLDLVVTGARQSRRTPVTEVYLNDGEGRFEAIQAGLVGVVEGSSDFADIDGDGDPDLVVTGDGIDTGRGVRSIRTANVYENLSDPREALAVTAVESNGRFSFGSTGVRVSFPDDPGSGHVEVEKIGVQPGQTRGIEQDRVSAYRFLIQADTSLWVGDNVEVSLDVSTLAGIDDPNNVTVYRRPQENTGFFEPLPTTYDPSRGELRATTPGFGEFVLASNSELLPVELTRLRASAGGDEVTLRWETASEMNNSGFQVQRKTETGAFRKIGFVKGGGTTTEPQTYQFKDTDLPYDADSLVYRLKQVDTDGSSSLSEVITVSRRAPEEVHLLGTFPNPTHSQATVRYALPQREKITIRVYDVLGRQVATVKRGPADPGRKQLQLDTSDLTSGTYFLRLTAGETTRTRKLTVVK